ncbi:MAG: hypothetical protein U1E65_11690 [Myxococcota bacterium]
MKRLIAGLLLALAASQTACAPNLCQRKERFFRGVCGGELSYSDPMCERNLDRCDATAKAAIEGYVSCLEAIGQCSQDAIAACGAQYPQGRNRFCEGEN